MATSDFLTVLQNGTSMRKLKKNGKLFRRKFRLQEDFLFLKQVDSKKKKWARSATFMDSGVLKLPVHDIDTIREGPHSDSFNKYFKKLNIQEKHCLSIVYAKRKCLDLVFDNDADRNLWLHGLKHLHNHSEQCKFHSEQEMWMKQLFHKSDKNDDGTLSFKEVQKLLANMNMEADAHTVSAIYNVADASDGWTMENFMNFCSKLTDREEIKSIFERYCNKSKYLDPKELQSFFKNSQHTELSEDECTKLIQQYEKCSSLQSKNKMSYYAFHSMMAAQFMSIFNMEHAAVYQDMKRPLAHYWIDSSHNTYLMEDQIKGPSAVDAYIRALIRGCRCVELDCWDGSKGDPVIYHGYTMTSKIYFKDVIDGIKQYAFQQSQYPVILSIENHCSVEQQQKMAHYLKTILGDALFVTPLPDIDELPSPEALKGKVVIKAKKLPPHATEDGEISEDDEATEIEDEEVKQNVKQKNKHKIKLSRELSDLVSICQSVHFNGFDYAAKHYNCKQMSSFGESKADGLAESSPKEYIVHNHKQLSRIYPAGSRINSSNYNPVKFWNTGCQIVALNYQTDDEPMMLYKGRFLDNGACGFVLKPNILLANDGKFDPKLPAASQPQEWKKTITIVVISGYQLPKARKAKSNNIIDPYIQMEVEGIEADNKSCRTEHVHNNGFNPVWNETITFEVSVPQLAILFFKLWDHDDFGNDDLVAQYALPVNSIQQGYRTVHLTTKHSDHIHGAYLFVHVTIN